MLGSIEVTVEKGRRMLLSIEDQILSTIQENSENIVSSIEGVVGLFVFGTSTTLDPSPSMFPSMRPLTKSLAILPTEKKSRATFESLGIPILSTAAAILGFAGLVMVFRRKISKERENANHSHETETNLVKEEEANIVSWRDIMYIEQ